MIKSEDWLFMVNLGWHPLLEETFEKMERVGEEYHADVLIADVKEKYGVLRIDYDINGNFLRGARGKLDQIAEDAEIKSGKVCELCGAPGKLRTERAWFKTLCDECNDKHYRRVT